MPLQIEIILDESQFSVDIAKYCGSEDSPPNSQAIAKIVEFCDQTGASVNVADSDKIELIRIRDGFAKDCLCLDSGTAERAIKQVSNTLRDAYPKSRVTFLYLLAFATDSVEKLAKTNSDNQGTSAIDSPEPSEPAANL